MQVRLYNRHGTRECGKILKRQVKTEIIPKYGFNNIRYENFELSNILVKLHDVETLIPGDKNNDLLLVSEADIKTM